MKIDTNGNIYTFIYAAVMVIIVAAALAFAAYMLQPKQDLNVKIEKMQNILQSVGIESTVEDAETEFKKYITKQIVVNTNGEELDGNAFDLNMKTEGRKAKKVSALRQKIASLNTPPSLFGKFLKKILNTNNEEEAKFLQTELKNVKSELNLPIFVCEKEGALFYILPLQGNGLWGPVWGYIALESDFNTIFGAVFDHKAETPGLGADINKDWFENPFKGKTIFEGNELISITLHKGGKGSAELIGDTEHGCDAISGGTITSKAVERMLKEEWLFNYEAFLKKNKK